MAWASPFRRLTSASMASSLPGVWVQVFFPVPLAFPGRGALSSSSRMTKSRVGSCLRLLAFGSSALSEKGSSSEGSLGVCFPQTFSRCCELELGALLGDWETRLGGAHFRRLVIESSCSPKESTGPVDFFQHFSSSLCASASSFPLASSFQNNLAACLANWCDFLPESGVVFCLSGRGKVGFGRSLRRTWHILACGYSCDPLHQGCWPTGQAAGRAQEG